MRIGYGYRNHRLEWLDYPRTLELKLPPSSGKSKRRGRPELQARFQKIDITWALALPNQIAHLRVRSANHQWLSLVN